MRYILQAEHLDYKGPFGYKIASFGGYYGLYQWSNNRECPEFCKKMTGFVTRLSNWPIPETECLTDLPEACRFETYEELQQYVSETCVIRMDWVAMV